MTDNVIQLFPPKTEKPTIDSEERIWRCSCGSATFYFHWNGDIECSFPDWGKFQVGHDEFLV